MYNFLKNTDQFLPILFCKNSPELTDVGQTNYLIALFKDKTNENYLIDSIIYVNKPEFAYVKKSYSNLTDKKETIDIINQIQSSIMSEQALHKNYLFFSEIKNATETEEIIKQWIKS